MSPHSRRESQFESNGPRGGELHRVQEWVFLTLKRSVFSISVGTQDLEIRCPCVECIKQNSESLSAALKKTLPCAYLCLFCCIDLEAGAKPIRVEMRTPCSSFGTYSKDSFL